MQWEQVDVAQGEEAGRCKGKTSFLSKGNRHNGYQQDVL